MNQVLRMCIQVPGRVSKVQGKLAIMEDGRKVRLGPLQGVQAGDSLEVYADIALGRLDGTHGAGFVNKQTQGDVQ